MKSKGILKIALLICLNLVLMAALGYMIFHEAYDTAPENILSDTTIQIPSETDVVSQSEIEEITKNEPVVIQAEKISLSVYSPYIVEGHSLKIDAVISPADAAMAKISWKSSDENVAVVSEDGTVEGKAKGTAYISATAENGVCAVQPIYVAKQGMIFLSPSRQTGNYYFNWKVTECKQAFLMSGYCMERLKAVGFEVYECPIKYHLEERGELAADMKSKCYIAIHTNAGGNEKGTMVFYNRKSESAMRLALCVYDTVAPLTPDEDAGLKNGVDYKECKYPYEAGVPSILLEVDFHDKEESGQWLLDNVEPIGYVIADGIMRFMYENY